MHGIRRSEAIIDVETFEDYIYIYAETGSNVLKRVHLENIFDLDLWHIWAYSV